MSEPIRIAVFDEHPLYRHGVVRAIERKRGMTVVAQGAQREARTVAIEKDLDILLLGSCGGDLDDAREILSVRKSLRLVVLTASDKEEHLSEALRTGVVGYILRDVSGAELLQALQVINDGKHYITPSLTLSLVVRQLQPRVPESADATDKDRIHLTPHERQVLSRLALGLSRAEIAREMNSRLTVIKHDITKLFRKIGVRNRLEAICASQKLLIFLHIVI